MTRPSYSDRIPEGSFVRIKEDPYKSVYKIKSYDSYKFALCLRPVRGGRKLRSARVWWPLLEELSPLEQLALTASSNEWYRLQQ